MHHRRAHPLSPWPMSMPCGPPASPSLTGMPNGCTSIPDGPPTSPNPMNVSNDERQTHMADPVAQT
ncbi:hypothetical protein BDN67DRAFT_913982 [Paxillus ammoniavirescens]|nr:hypothetical protein BDN67DRAFT_913982 [Paxillus ammoniavirescens]